MANWTATLTGAALSSDKSNAIITVTLQNSVTNETQTRQFSTSTNYSLNWLKAQCEQMIAALVARDDVLATMNDAINQGGAAIILATG